MANTQSFTRLQIWLNIALAERGFTDKKKKTCAVFLSSFSINLLAFYHEGRSLIGYATHYLFCDR